MILSEINRKVEELHFDGALCQRVISIEMEPVGENTLITTWQCNMASMKTTDLKLPTVLRIVLNAAGVAIEAELMENFKGSQGIPCSQTYLNRILKSRLIGLCFLNDDTVLRNELMFHCRHIFELSAAAITFYRFCSTHLNERNKLYECTKAFPEPKGILVKDDYHINGHHITVDEHLSFSASDISMQTDGKIGRIEHFGLEAQVFYDDGPQAPLSDEIIQISGSDNTIMSMMKLFVEPWKSIGRKLGVRRNYYFSNLVPSSLYGVMIQAIALTLFPNNYNYFQHSLAGLQRNEERPLCVGMVLDHNELHKFYPEFKKEDLLG
jgi:hypothetical protein